jgi:hypothetical protein
MSELSLAHAFQYSSARHQAESAISGMWLFLATEVLFFGALFLAWIYCRHWNPLGFDEGGRQTNLAIGTINTLLGCGAMERSLPPIHVIGGGLAGSETVWQVARAGIPVLHRDAAGARNAGASHQKPRRIRLFKFVSRRRPGRERSRHFAP